MKRQGKARAGGGGRTSKGAAAFRGGTRRRVRPWTLRVGAFLGALFLLIGRGGAEFRFDVWTTEDGLPQNSVRAIRQSRDGYLWVGTLDGLARFDGVRFTVFNKANSPGLPGNRITELCEDRDGALWIALDDGRLARYQRGEFTAFGLEQGLTSNPIRSLSADEHGHLWICAGQALLRWEEGRFVAGYPDDLQRWFTGDIMTGHSLIWTTNSSRLHVFSQGRLTTLGLADGLPTLRIVQVDADQHGALWVATEDAGVVQVRGGRVARTYAQRDGLPRDRFGPYLGPTAPPLAYEDRKGNLWVNGVGPWLGRLQGGAFTAYPSATTLSSHPLPAAPGPPGGHLNALFEDAEGNVWLGTEGTGLIRIREQVINTFSTRHGLAESNVYPTYEDRSGAVWLGVWEQGLARIRDGQVTNFVVALVTALGEDSAGQLWVGLIGGVRIFQNGAISGTGVPDGLRDETVSAICRDRSGALWFGGERGLFRYGNGELVTFRPRDGLAGDYLSVIIEARDGALWIGGRNGLTQWSNGAFRAWTEREGLPSNHVRALYEDDEGVLWIGTYDGGLARFKDGRFTAYTTREGMYDNGVFQILEDAHASLWMSSNRGIHRVRKRELNEVADGQRRRISSIAYGTTDGLLNAECNGGRWPAGVKTRDGRLWFPTQDGVAVIDPATLPPDGSPPPVVIESLVVDGEFQPLDRPLHVPPGKTNFEIQYTALSFVNSHRLLFKYRLAGMDADWVEAGTRRTAYYSHLAPGPYTFTVLAASSDGVWNETGASLAFIVRPAWNQTWWFRAACAAGFLSLLGYAYGQRVARLERAQAAEREFSRRLMESQEQERQRLAAELHDSLGQYLVLLKNLAILDQAGPPKPAGPASHAPEMASLADRALEEVHAISYALRPPELDRLGLSEALREMVRRAGEASGIAFRPGIDFKGALPDGHDIQLFRIAQEAVNNLVRHSGARTARVELWRDEGGIHLVVADDGCGLPSAPPDRDRHRNGLGLSGIEERARLIGAQCRWISQPGQGTTLSVRLPPNPCRQEPV